MMLGLQSLHGDELGALGGNFPCRVGTDGASLGDEAEVVDESRRIVAVHFGRDVDLHDGPWSIWYASQRLAVSIAEV